MLKEEGLIPTKAVWGTLKTRGWVLLDRNFKYILVGVMTGVAATVHGQYPRDGTCNMQASQQQIKPTKIKEQRAPNKAAQTNM